MINSNTSFGKLKHVIVGRELELPKRIADFSFQHFYQENLDQAVYDKLYSGEEEYYVNHEILVKRNEQLDQLASQIEGMGIKVSRPKKLNKVIPFKTPSFSSELSSASNVRDVTLVYGNKIIETPTYVQNRYFENISLYDVYSEAFNGGKGGQWIRPPHTELSKETVDLSEWNMKRDYQNFDKSKFAMAIDGAQFLRIGNDVIVNINSYNHYLGYEWVKSFFPEVNFHMIHIADNHIDGAIACLRPGSFLINPKYASIKDHLPAKFKNWNFIIPKENTEIPIEKGMTSLDLKLASSRGMDMNVLSLDEKKVVVNKKAVAVIDSLLQNDFEPIICELDNCEVFGGGVHCSTLDLDREDQQIDYT